MRGRRILWVAVSSTVVVVGFGALQWREVAIRWRLAELERQDVEAELPVELVTAERGTIAREALERYVRTPAGKERLLRAYLSRLEERQDGVPNHLRGTGAGGSTAVLLFWMHEDGVFEASVGRAREPTDEGLTDDANERDSRTFPSGTVRWQRLKWLGFLPDRRASESMQVIQHLLLEAGYDRYPLPGHPGARFSIAYGPGVKKPRGRVFSSGFLWSPYACLIESDPYLYDPRAPSGR